ncbi:MAG: dihydrodipicolinate synthase family protein, partial [Nitrospinota bacterium]
MNFQGSVVAIVTPFSDGRIDKDSFKNLVEFNISNKTTAIVVAGTTGESPTLSHLEHNELVDDAIRFIDGRIPLIAGAGSNSTAEAIDLSKAAKESGAAATLVVNPYYNRPTQEGL